jgi:hypothetical protein
MPVYPTDHNVARVLLGCVERSPGRISTEDLAWLRGAAERNDQSEEGLWRVSRIYNAHIDGYKEKR